MPGRLHLTMLFVLRNFSHYRLAEIPQIFNGLALLLISLHSRLSMHRLAGPAIAIGGLGFSGTIMAMTLNRDWCCALFHQLNTLIMTGHL
jgi:uncharacterized membrane protein YgdD (TMEM256/DUF423 family)